MGICGELVNINQHLLSEIIMKSRAFVRIDSSLDLNVSVGSPDRVLYEAVSSRKSNVILL